MLRSSGLEANVGNVGIEPYTANFSSYEVTLMLTTFLRILLRGFSFSALPIELIPHNCENIEMSVPPFGVRPELNRPLFI